MTNERPVSLPTMLPTTLYLDNVTNNLGTTSYQDPAIFGNRAQAIVSQPRTVGLTVSYSLKR